MKPGIRVRRALWSVVIFLALIGSAVAVRRVAHLVPIVVGGYHPLAVTSNPVATQFAALDDLFAHYPILTLVSCYARLAFHAAGSAPIQLRHSRPPSPMASLEWSRFAVSGLLIGISALVMSLGMPAIGGFNQAAATTLFASFLLFALSKAFWHIQRREVAPHREWMIRAFSVGLAVATIRPIIGMFFATSRFQA